MDYTGSLTCVGLRDHSYVCVYTRGLGTPTASQYNIFDPEKLSQMFLVLLIDSGGIRTSGLFDLESDTLPTEPPRQHDH